MLCIACTTTLTVKHDHHSTCHTMFASSTTHVHGRPRGHVCTSQVNTCLNMGTPSHAPYAHAKEGCCSACSVLKAQEVAEQATCCTLGVAHGPRVIIFTRVRVSLQRRHVDLVLAYNGQWLCAFGGRGLHSDSEDLMAGALWHLYIVWLQAEHGAEHAAFKSVKSNTVFPLLAFGRWYLSVRASKAL